MCLARCIVILLTVSRPGPETATLLTLYDFTLANKLFCHHLVTQPSSDKDQAPPFSTFLSFLSYLYQHAYRSARSSLYAYLTLLILLILVEDATIAKQLCEISAPVRLCRQRPPFLPLPKTADRPYAATVLDLLADGVNHNLRKRLDTGFYVQSLTTLHRFVSYIAKSRTKITYHWSELWRTLLSLVRFLIQYVDGLRSISGTTELVQMLVDVLTLAMTTGEAFLPEAKDYDDLFYKLVECGDALVKLRDAYTLAQPEDRSAAINTLIGVSQHYRELIESHRAKKQHLSPREVNEIIKQGYETLAIEAKEGQEQIAKFREAEHKVELKKIARVAVVDAVGLVSGKE